MKLDPKRANPRLPRWIWSHDPETYTYENYANAVESMKKGVPFDEEDSVPPNYPRGYKYEPWDIEEIMADKRKGKDTDLGPGDWS